LPNSGEFGLPFLPEDTIDLAQNGEYDGIVYFNDELGGHVSST